MRRSFIARLASAHNLHINKHNYTTYLFLSEEASKHGCVVGFRFNRVRIDLQIDGTLGRILGIFGKETQLGEAIFINVFRECFLLTKGLLSVSSIEMREIAHSSVGTHVLLQALKRREVLSNAEVLLLNVDIEEDSDDNQS